MRIANLRGFAVKAAQRGLLGESARRRVTKPVRALPAPPTAVSSSQPTSSAQPLQDQRPSAPQLDQSELKQRLEDAHSRLKRRYPPKDEA